MWETVFLLTFAAFVLLATYFVDKLENKEDENGYNSEQDAKNDDT